MWTPNDLREESTQKPPVKVDSLPSSSDVVSALQQKIVERSATVGVVGLGYVGLPFAVEKAKAGFNVVGIDIDAQRVQQLNDGQNWIPDVEDDELASLQRRGLLSATSTYDNANELDVVVIAVPTPLTRNFAPDLGYVESAVRQLAKQLRKGQLICLESTIFPGATEDVVLPILAESGLEVEKDFFLAHSPERVDPGNALFNTKNTSKVVGGFGPHSHQIAVSFYSQSIDKVVPVNNIKAAEMVKVFENTFRAVNIGLVNEMAQLCDRMNVNVWELLEAAFTKPFGIMPFYPGPGVGGHCIPIDPHFMEWKAKEYNFNTQFVSLAGQVNRAMPDFVREKAVRILNRLGVAPSKSRVLVVGVAYKQNLSDCREAPAVDVMRLLADLGARVSYHDPHVPKLLESGFNLESVDLNHETLSAQDLVIVTAPHSSIDFDALVRDSGAVFDTVNATKKVQSNRNRITLL